MQAPPISSFPRTNIGCGLLMKAAIDESSERAAASLFMMIFIEYFVESYPKQSYHSSRKEFHERNRKPLRTALRKHDRSICRRECAWKEARKNVPEAAFSSRRLFSEEVRGRFRGVIFCGRRRLVATEVKSEIGEKTKKQLKTSPPCDRQRRKTSERAFIGPLACLCSCRVLRLLRRKTKVYSSVDSLSAHSDPVSPPEYR